MFISQHEGDMKMGRMYFPGEKVREYLPPRESRGDIVAKFGAWLTKKGVEKAYFGSYFIILGCIIIRLFVWVYQSFQVGIFRGIFSLVGAYFLAWISVYASFVGTIIVCIVVWMLGWLCYNKWTLIISLSLACALYLMTS